MWMLLLVACGVVPYGGIRPVPPVAVPTEVAAPSTALLAEIDRLLGSADEVDRRDRLVELRDLALGADRMEPTARARVLRYVARAIAIEARAVPSTIGEPVMEMAEGLGGVTETPIEEEEVGESEPPPAVPAPGAETAPPAPGAGP